MNVVVGTWSFSKYAVDTAINVSKNDTNISLVQSVEKGINVLETDEKFGPCFVGKGGVRNCAGQLELDAAIMNGNNMAFGSVTALSGVPTAISVARKVMEISPHSMLTGEGAMSFAKSNGFVIDESLLKSPKTDPTPECTQTGHDTIGLLALDVDGNVCAGVSTSGAANKQPGRVGDSALPGCGLFADNKGGAACCSGDGDELLKYCPSHSVVTFMKQGFSPTEACELVVNDILERTSKETVEIGIIGVNMKGEVGAATTVGTWTDPLTSDVYPGFPYTVWTDGMEEGKIRVCSPVKLCKI